MACTMSELLAAAAAALGIPEDLASRSAQARATATGSSLDAVLAAWTGGSPVSPAAVSPEAGPGQEPAPTRPADSSPSLEPTFEIPLPVPAPPAAASPVPTGGSPPVLIGATDNPMTVLVSAVVLFVIMVLVGLVGPSLAADAPGTRTSIIAHSEAGLAGERVYESQGCGSCHTQMVRPIVSDVGLGPATLGDSNQVLGTRRFGPDLSNVGSRLTNTNLRAVLEGSGEHGRFFLSPADMENLIAYLHESSSPVSG